MLNPEGCTSFLSHFYEALAFSDKSEVCVTYMGIPFQLFRNVLSVLRKAYFVSECLLFARHHSVSPGNSSD